MSDPYENLANEIIFRAVKDYRWALNKLKKRPNHGLAMRIKNEVESFFRSSYYRELTGVDGNYLIGKIRSEVS